MVWKVGESGNPNGRPRGTRDRITRRFLLDLARDYEKHGVDAIARMREAEPGSYVKVIAALLPKDVHVEAGDEFVMQLVALGRVVAERRAQLDVRTINGGVMPENGRTIRPATLEGKFAIPVEKARA